MSDALSDDHEPGPVSSPRVRVSTASPTAVEELLEPGISQFRRTAPLGVSSAATLRDSIASLAAWAAGTNRRIGTLSELAAGEVSVGIRVDVDIAIADSVTLARTVLGDVRATWSVLHTAGYAGYWSSGSWYRHVGFASVYRTLAEHGEIALHVDAFGLAASADADPGPFIVSELQWLRDEVNAVRGVSAHDAAPVHGAENFEIFKQWALSVPGVARSDRYQRLAGSLDADELGIEWCAGSPRPGPGGQPATAYLDPPPAWPLQSAAWMRTYLHDGPYCRWFDGCDVWLVGDDRWALSDRVNGRYFHGLTWLGVLEVLMTLDADVIVSVCIHPIYVDFATS